MAALLPPGHRASVLRHYRELLDLIKRLPSQEQGVALQQARDQVRANAGEANPMQAQEHLKRLASRVSFLRATTPRLPRDRYRTSGRYVVRGGQLVEGADVVDKGSRVADGTISASEAHTLHRRLMKRQYFGREPPRFNEPF